MASPFSIFRKNQKAAMAALTIMLMVAFSIGGVLSYSEMFGPAGQSDAVARTRYKTYHAADLDRMMQSRRLATNFIELARSRAAKLPGNLSPSALDPRFARPFGSFAPGEVMRARVLADQAKRMGLVISDKAVMDYIATAVLEFVNLIRQFNPSATGELTGEDYAVILKELAGGKDDSRPIPESRVIDAIRTELLVGKLHEMFSRNVQLTPAQRWEFFLRLNRKVKAEVLPIKAEDMIGQVENPSESELKTFFEKHNEREAVPGSPEPGFKVPAKAALQYFVADYEKFYEVAEVSVTKEDIEKEYEKNKDTEYRWQNLGGNSDLDDLPIDDKPKAETEKPKTDAPKTDAPKTDPPKTETPKTDAPPKGEEPAKPEAKKPDEKKPEDKPAEPKKPESDKSSDAEPKKPADNPDSKKSGSLLRALPALALTGSDAWTRGIHGLPLFSAILSDDPAEEKKPGNEPAKDPAEKKPADDEKAPEKKPTAEGDDKAKPEGATDPAAPASGVAGVKFPASPPLPISEENLLPLTIKEGPSPKYSPLWKVEKDIRKKLAEQRVSDKIKKAFEQIREQMDAYLVAYTNWEFSKKNEPKPLDYQGMAKTYGLTLHETPLVTALQVSKMPDLGGAMVAREPLVAVLFSGLRVYQARTAQDTKGNQYLVWKTKDEKSYVPKLDDKAIRDEVVHAWKMIKARTLAEKKAEELAKQAETAKQSLADLFGKKPDMKVTETNEFSWMTTGTAGGFDFNRNMQPTMSEVQGVDEPGEAFMKKVSEMNVGDVGVALNQPETIAYVIRVTRVDPDQVILHTRFISQNFSAYQAVAGQEIFQQRQAWSNHMLKEVDFQPLGRLDASNEQDEF
jgi:hypothetical protein